MKHICKGFASAIIAGTLLMVFLNAATAFSQDLTKPTLSITNPVKSGLLWSNVTFTVQGKAADNASVSNVVYSLNQGEWKNAETENGWTNWSAELDLIPGTNTIAAYAVDMSGNRSVTNTTKLVYYLTDVLTVRTNGNLKVSIKPAYNGARLQIGVNYSITASSSSVPGFGLLNWTDGSNHILTNKPTLKFMMVSNLVLTANLGDNGKPVVRVTSSSTNAAGDLNVLVLNGTATDNVGVSNVFYRMNNGFWQSVPTTNHWTNWTTTVSLNPGVNTFQIYAVDTNLNASPVIPVNIFNTTTPTTLSGLQATVAPDGSAPFQVAFGKKTFSQVASKGDTNNVNGVGSYTYIKGTDGAYANLKIKYTGPPSATNEGSRTLGLYFADRNTAYFNTTELVATNVSFLFTNNVNEVITNSYDTNVLVTVTGTMSFSPTPKFAPSSVVNQFLISAGSDVDSGYGTFFQRGIFTTYPLLSSGTNTGKYTYALYSPMSALFKLTNTNGTDYIIATYGGTNYGGYYSEAYTPAGVTNGTDNGHFIFASQKPGGNAPPALTNRNFQIFANDGDFNVQFGSSTYSQDSVTTNYDNAVGAYTYSLANTNIGLLNLTVTAPPHLAGNTNAARLIFVASNAGIFTNNDGTFSTFAISSLTNFPLTSVAGTTLNITEETGASDTVQLASDGSFNYGDEPVGHFDYTVYSPAGSMLVLSVTNTSFTVVTNTDYSYLTNLDDTIVTNVDYSYVTNANYKPQDFWLQLHLTSAQGGTNTGSTYVNIYTNSVLSDFFRGRYRLH